MNITLLQAVMFRPATGVFREGLNQEKAEDDSPTPPAVIDTIITVHSLSCEIWSKESLRSFADISPVSTTCCN